jgi:signal transduction histidine kinase
MRPTDQTPPAAIKSRFWWLPLLLISAALVSLFAAALLTTTRLQRIREHVADVVSPALMHTNELEAALATEFAARSELAYRPGQSLSAARAAAMSRTAATKDERALDSLVRRADPEVISLYAEARASISAWQREEDRFADEAAGAAGAAVHASSASGTRDRRWEAIQVALADTRRLEDDLNARTKAEHAAIERLGRLGVIVPAALVPLALLALVALAWTARRTLLLSQAAETGQRNAERAMAAKAALMRGITHDLKNPLGAACGFADLLVDGALGPLPEPQRKMLGRVRSLVSATLDTVNDLVDLSRTEADKLRIDRLVCDVTQIARDCVDDYRASSDAAGLQLVFQESGANARLASRVSSDPIRVRQVLGNMLSNAVKYTPRNGAVTVIVTATVDAELGDIVAIEVADSGPGIPEELHERVFEEFFRVPATQAIAKGTGVGLAIARRIARLLGGDLRVHETPGGGATFSFILPRPGSARSQPSAIGSTL